MNESEPTALIKSELLQSICRQIRFQTGDVLRQKGQHYQDMYVITDGCVEVDLESGREAAKVVLSHPGFPIGEIGFLRGCPAMATVIARAPTTGLVIDDPTLARLEHEQPALTAHLLRHLADAAEERRSYNLPTTYTRPKTIEVYLCRNNEMLERAQRLRYEVYCQELGRRSPYADHDRRIITDHLDDAGHTFVAIEAGETIGTLRTNLSSEGSNWYPRGIVWDENVTASSRGNGYLHEIRRQKIEAWQRGIDEIDSCGGSVRYPKSYRGMLHRLHPCTVAVLQGNRLQDHRTAETRAAFFKQLSALLAADHPALAVLTLRADHLSDLQTAEGLAARFEDFLLNPMPIERLGLIVQGPARVAGLRAEDALVAAIARDAKTLDVLPLVAFTLRQLHDRYASGGVLMAVHYEALRDGPLSPLEVVVRDAAKATLDAANPSAEELAALREAFVPALVKVNDEGGFVRDVAELDALPQLAQRLLRSLADARLLVIAPDDGTTRVEVAHEAIFRVWPLLAGWLEEEREFLIGRSRIEKAREDYARLGGSEQVKGLLTGILLERAKAWLAAHPARFSADEAAYINASADEAQRLEAERAAERERLRQAELARAQAETERATERAETARRWQRRAVAAAVVFAVLGVIATALGGVATKFWRTAEQARKETQASLWLLRSRSDLNDGQVASAIEHAARAFKELPNEASRSALASAMFEVSPHLRATFDVAATGAEAIAWVSGDAVVFAPAKAGGALRALDVTSAGRGRAGSAWPMPRLTRTQDGNRATVRAMRGLGAERIMAVLDTGALVLTERGGTAAQVWSPPSPARSLQAGAHSASVGARGTLIATASIDGEVTILECVIPAARQAAPDCRERALADVRGKAVAVSPDESRIAVADGNGLVSIYDRAGLRLGEPIKVGGALLALGWATAADWLAAGNANGDIVIVDAGDPARPVIAKASLAGAPITTLAWSSRGLDLAFACEGAPVCLWSGAVDAQGAATLAPIRRFEGHSNGVTHLAWSPGGDQIVSASADGTMRVWSVAQDADAGFTLYTETSAQLTKVAASPDGRWLAAGAKDGSVRIWDAAAGSLLRTIKSANESEVAALAWAQSGLLAAAHDGRGITLIPPNPAQAAQEIDIDTDQDTRIVFAQHDRSIAMPLHSDKRVVLIEVAAFGTRARHYLQPIGPDQVPWGLAADPSGQMLFVSYTDADGEIRIWDAATRQPAGTMAYTLAEKRDPVAAGSLAVSRDGRWLATSGGDSYVRVYDIPRKRSWRALAMDVTFDGPRAVVFSPDGSKLAALGSDNRVYLWSLREDGAERYVVFGALPRRSAVADAKDRERAATWLAWMGNDAIAVATTESAMNVIGLDPAKWQRRIEALALVSVAPQS